MKLRTRLIISFCIIIFVPVLLAVATMWGFGRYQMRTLRHIYNRLIISVFPKPGKSHTDGLRAEQF